MPRGVQATNPSRALYNDLRREYGGGVIITDSYLRLEKSLQGTLSQVVFDVLVNQGNMNVTEKRLSITDKFCAASISIKIMKAGASVAATQAEIAVAIPRTYPNVSVFTGAAEAANLHAIYNSSLAIRIDSTVWIDSLDVERFYRVPTSQKGIAVSAVAVTGVIGDDEVDMLNYGFSPLTPTIMLNGRGKNEITLTLPTSILTSGTTSQNFVICEMRGYLLQNAAKGS